MSSKRPAAAKKTVKRAAKKAAKAAAPLTGFTPKKRAQFLDALRGGASVARAATAAGWSRQSAYNYRRDYLDFADEWEQAVEAGTDLLEDEALRRAMAGDRRYAFDRNGDPLLHPETGEPYYEKQYSDTLLIVMLKARRPEKYAARAQLEHSGRVEQSLPDVLTTAIDKIYGKNDNEKGEEIA